MKPTVLVTGAAGFVGRHLVRFLQTEGVRVIGLDRPGRTPVDGECDEWWEYDLTEPKGLDRILDSCPPSRVFHMAALTGGDLKDLLNVNVEGTRVLLDAVARLRPAPRVLVPGSAAEYGTSGDSHRLFTEDDPPRPVSFYGVSKVAQSTLAETYWMNFAVPVIRTRTFNITGPGEPPSLVCSGIAHQIAICEKNGGGDLNVGSLESERDFVDARDVVRAYSQISLVGTPGRIYNVCSGHPSSIRLVLSTLLAMSKTRIEVRQKEARETPTTRSVGSPDVIHAATGWRPGIRLQDSLRDLLEWCRRGEDGL